jgi:hypothetical protein
MESHLFGNSPLLKSFILPPSLSTVDRACFWGSSIEDILVDSENKCFFASGGFLIAFEGMTVIRHFGLVHDLVLSPDYETLGRCSFIERNCSSIAFESGSKLTRIGDHAFALCSSLKAICIPASVEFLGEQCFLRCMSLIQLTFESGSRLTQIGKEAFEQCSALPSICLPAQLDFIPSECFNRCSSLTVLSFEPGSRLTRIETGALDRCGSLRVITIPANLEEIESSVFALCNSVSQLIFEMPSRLRRLALPPSNFDPLCIPDSVEVVSAPSLCGRNPLLLQFGRESRLTILDISHPARRNRVFVHLHEQTLRTFRCAFESDLAGQTGSEFMPFLEYEKPDQISEICSAGCRHVVLSFLFALSQEYRVESE